MTTVLIYLSLSFAVLMILMMLVLIYRSHFYQIRHSKHGALCDLLDYASMVDDHVLLLKSGGLLATYEIKLPDLAVMSVNQIKHIYELSQKALLKLSGNYCVQVDLVRNADENYVPFVSSDIDVVQDFERQRQELFATQGCFASRLYLSITYVGVSKTETFLERLVSADTNVTIDEQSQTLKIISDFKAACNNVTDTLALSFKVRPLTIKELHLPQGHVPLLPPCANPEAETAYTTQTATQAVAAPAATVTASTPVTLTHNGNAATLGADVATHDEAESETEAEAKAKAKAEAKAEAERHDIAASKFAAVENGHFLYHEGLSFIHQCITGLKHKIALPQSRCYLDAVLSTEDFTHGYTPQIGKMKLAIIAIEGLPARSHEGLLNSLASLPFSYRFNTRFIYFDSLTSSFLLDKYRRYWAQKSRGLLAQIFNLQHARVNQNAIDKVAELDKAKRALDNNEVVFGAYTATLIMMAENEMTLSAQSKLAIQAIENIGLSARVETVNATDAFFGSLPGHYFENLRRPIISQDVLLDMLPLSAPDCGEMTSPNPLYGSHASPLMQVRTSGLSAYYLNVHEQDLGNSLVVGPPGSGKSVLLGELIVNLLRYQGMRIFAFDKGYSFYALTKALGGTHITFDNTKSDLCPLEQLQSELDFDYAISYLEMLLRLNGHSITPPERNELLDCLHILANRVSNKRSLSDLHLILASRDLKEALAPYTKWHNSSCLIDGTTNIGFISHLTTFECGDIFKASSTFSLPVLKQVFHLIEKQFDGRPAAIILDEAWLMLQDQTFGDELIKWFKTLRKFNAIVILATQSLTDLEQSPHFINLLECAKTRFFLANSDASTDLLRPIYQRLGLSASEVDLIAAAAPKRDYYFVKNDQRILFNLLLSKQELQLLSVAGDHNKDRIDRLYAQYGPRFYRHLGERYRTYHHSYPEADTAANAVSAVSAVSAAPSNPIVADHSIGDSYVA